MTNLLKCCVLATVCGLLLPTVAMAQAQPRIEPVQECFATPPENISRNSGSDCGYVVVPQSREGGPGRKIRVAYMRLRAATKTEAPPVFMLAGGPGQSGIQDDKLLLFQPDLLGPVLETRDVVLMEQRGAFHSQPHLDCPEAQSAGFEALRDRLTHEAAKVLEMDRLRACIKRHEAAGADFSAYNTVENAADVDDVRGALGYEKIVFYGASYATLLGQYAMRQFPDHLAAVILDGTDALSGHGWIENRAINAQWGIDNLSRLCAAEPGCSEAYDIPVLLKAGLDLFEEGPITVSVPIPGDDDAATVELTVTAGDFAEFLYGLQSSKYGVAALPMELTELVQGGRDLVGEMLAQQAVARAVAGRNDPEAEMTTLMHAAMVCSDDPVHSLDDIRIGETGQYAQTFARAAGQIYVDLCEVMNVRQLSDALDEDVQTDMPVLILSGGLDVQTPYFLAEEVASKLPQAKQVIFPAGFHVQLANINRCAMEVMKAFLRDLDGELATACVSEGQPLPFVLHEAVTDGSN